MKELKKQELGFAHLQLLLIAGVALLAIGLVVVRVANSSKSNANDSALSQEELQTLANEAKLIDEDHDLIPLCNSDITENCEDEAEDSDFDNDGTPDTEDSDDNNDGELPE